MADDLILLGRKVGTYDGWDDGGDYQIFYQVAPIIPNFPSGDLSVGLESGLVKTYSDDGTETSSQDLVELLKDVPREPKE